MKRRDFLKTGGAVLGAAVMMDRMHSIISGERTVEAAPSAGKTSKRGFETCLGPYNTKGLSAAMP